MGLKPRLSTLTLAGLAVAGLTLAGLTSQLSSTSQDALEDLARQQMAQTGEIVNQKVTHFLGSAEDALNQARVGLEGGVWWQGKGNPENLLGEFGVLLETRDDIEEISLTFPKRDPLAQVAVMREKKGIRKITVARPAAKDPADHLTYKTLVDPEFAGRKLWSDLHYSQRDQMIVVTVQQAMKRPENTVLRVGLSTDLLDEEVRMAAPPGHRTYLTDYQGRGVTRLDPKQKFSETSDDELRTDVPPANYRHVLRVTRRLQDPEWIIVTEADAAVYLSTLERIRHTLLAQAWGFLSLVALVSFWIWRRMRRDLSGLVAEAQRLERFEFDEGLKPGTFREVHQVLAALEGARISLKALGKYAPLELVKTLHSMRREPQLGGTSQQVSVMFTDIENFTTLSEAIPPDEMAELLGLYLEAMTSAVHAHGGIIDKYVGDAVMALWNAPLPQDDHVLRMVEAALDSRDAAQDLFQAPCWEGRKPWITRIGLHCDQVLVGHFGSPERMSYTVLGDGVNLAARLEGLNKTYGTTVMVSQAVEQATSDHFHYRRLDRVAVKGKHESVFVYELLGRKGEVEKSVLDGCRMYEEAYLSYLDRRFQQAISRLDEVDDGPARWLRARCREFQSRPPGPDWDGVSRPTHK